VRRAALLVLAGVICDAPGAVEPPPLNLERAEQLYVICGACHGARAQGERSLLAPTLAGQQPAYLLRQLRLFASGARALEGDPQGKEMKQMLETIASEDDWKLLVGYIGTLPAPQPAPASAGASRGKELYQACAACHGAAGEGIEALSAPRLALLPGWYIESQLNKFRKGLRGADASDVPAMQMRAASSILQTDAEVAAVAGYIGTASVP
jgi:cytochrome c oxidase subunit 2